MENYIYTKMESYVQKLGLYTQREFGLNIATKSVSTSGPAHAPDVTVTIEVPI